MGRGRGRYYYNDKIETIGDLTYCFDNFQKIKFIEFLKSVEVEDEEKEKIEYLIQDITDKMEFEEIQKKAEEAAEKGETTIPKEKWGVHVHHCCVDHGCKYGDVDCPVALDLFEQHHDCEYCEIEDKEEEYYKNYKPRERKRRKNEISGNN